MSGAVLIVVLAIFGAVKIVLTLVLVILVHALYFNDIFLIT